MFPVTPKEAQKHGYKAIAKVPLIIIDKDIGKRVITKTTTHTSISPFIQYLTLPEITLYDYQRLLLSDLPEPLIYQKLSPRDEVYIYDEHGNENTFTLNGDASAFKNYHNGSERLKALINYWRK